jgi:cytoskeletal protein CcmA (bactofilin family)
MKAGDGVTTIGRSTILRGDLVATEDVVIEGSVEGSVQALANRVTVSAEAKVRADISAQEIVVEGHVEGTLRATERVELRAHSVVQGDVLAKRFSMEQDAMLRGKVDPSRATEAAKAVEAAPVRFTPITPLAGASLATPTAAAAPSLFGTGRLPGQMPSGLAAAARNFGTAATPGMSALSEDGPAGAGDEDGVASEPKH